MASVFSRFRSDIEDDLETQVARLSKDLAGLKKTLSRRGADAYSDARDDAADYYDALHERLSDAMPMVRRRAREAGQLAQDNPKSAALVGLVVVGLLAAMLFRR